VTSRVVISNGCRIRYEVEHASQPGDVLVLLHGFGGSAEAWFDQGYVDALARWRLLVVDLLGHGGSDKPHEAGRYSHAARAADLVAVLDDAGVARAHVWGYSMGGRNAYGFAAHAPGRCASLIVGGAAPETGGADQEPAWMDRRAAALDRGDWAELWRLMGGAPRNDAYRREFESNDPLALAAASRGLRDWPVASAADLRLPSLHYTGTDDPFADRVRAAASAMGGTLLELEGATHLQAPGHVTEIVNAVSSHLAAVRLDA
jgi:pimeloyl-ACP methyl ester carboxylesterase